MTRKKPNPIILVVLFCMHVMNLLVLSSMSLKKHVQSYHLQPLPRRTALGRFVRLRKFTALPHISPLFTLFNFRPFFLKSHGSSGTLASSLPTIE